MWGEIKNEQQPEEKNELINLTPVIEQSRHKDCLSMYQIASCVQENKEIMLAPMNPRMLYAAELHRYIGQMTDYIDNAELAVEYNLVMPTEVPVAVMPEPPVVPKTVKIRKPIHFVDKEYSKFTLGFSENQPFICELTRKQIQKQCIATMLSHIGFINSNSTVLDVLADIFESFMLKFCSDLRSLNDSLLSGSTSAFSDIVEETLVQNGLGGVKGICEYYERRINKYETVLKERCQNVVSRYEALLSPVNMPVECKTERMDNMETEDIPEVHFSAMDGEEGYLQPFLESGFQMLTSLEEGQYVT